MDRSADVKIVKVLATAIVAVILIVSLTAMYQTHVRAQAEIDQHHTEVEKEIATQTQKSERGHWLWGSRSEKEEK